MSATPRDLLKTRASRVGEVYSDNALKNGQANSQLVSFGCVLAVGGTATKLAVGAGEFVLAQAIVPFAAVASATVPAGATTGAGQFCKVLVESNAAGALTLTAGALAGSQATAPLPLGDPTKISLGWIEIPASFTPDTTSLTGGMLKQMPYSAA